MTDDLPNEAAGNRYAYKASLIGSGHQFELTEQGLAWKVGGKSGVWRYADIAVVRLSYRPISMQSRRFRADIELGNRQRITILSTNWQTVTLMAPQDRDYRAFITQSACADEAGRCRGRAGWRPRSGLYAAAVVVVALVAISIAGLLGARARDRRIRRRAVPGRLCRAVRLADRRLHPAQPAAEL